MILSMSMSIYIDEPKGKFLNNKIFTKKFTSPLSFCVVVDPSEIPCEWEFDFSMKNLIPRSRLERKNAISHRFLFLNHNPNQYLTYSISTSKHEFAVLLCIIDIFKKKKKKKNNYIFLQKVSLVLDSYWKELYKSILLIEVRS